MKTSIIITTSETVANSTIQALADCINTIKPDEVKPADVTRAKHNITTPNKTVEGPAYRATYEYNESSEACMASISIEDEAILMALPVAVKFAKLVAPVVSMGKAMYDLVKSLSGSSKLLMNDLNRSINSKWGRPDQFAIIPVHIEELDIEAVAMMRYSGFGHLSMVEAKAVGQCHMFDAIEAYARKKTEEAIASKDKKFFIATRDEADWQYEAVWNTICEEHDKKCRKIPGAVCSEAEDDE